MKARRKERLYYDPFRDGVTQGILSKWLTCRERAKLWAQGWSSGGSSPAMIWGSVFHEYLHILCDARKNDPEFRPASDFVASAVGDAINAVEFRFPASDGWDVDAAEKREIMLGEIEILGLFYPKVWSEDFDGSTEWVALENKFRVPLDVGLDRPVPIRGMFDGVLRRGAKKKALWLLETKTKSQVKRDILDTLSLDLQVSVYLWALWKVQGVKPRGVVYNVVRRPGLRRGKKDVTVMDFLARVAQDVSDRTDHYYQRFEAAISASEMNEFEAMFRCMVREFVEWWRGVTGTYRNGSACSSPWSCTYLAACGADDFSGLEKRDHVFPELEC